MASNKTVTLSGADLEAVRAYYEKERNDLFVKLQYIDQVLSTLEPGSGKRPLPSPSKLRVSKKAEPVGYKRGRLKKRGPKSVWGNFILRRIRQCDRPVSYTELIRDAMLMHNLPASHKSKARSSILNAAFRLRAVQGKIDTRGLTGRKERFLVLTSWLDSNEKLIPEYQEKLESMGRMSVSERGGAPTRMSGAGDTKRILGRMSLTALDIKNAKEAGALFKDELAEKKLAKKKKLKKGSAAPKPKRGRPKLGRPAGRVKVAQPKAKRVTKKVTKKVAKKVAKKVTPKATKKVAKKVAPKATKKVAKKKSAPAPKPAPSKRRRIHVAKAAPKKKK